LCDFVNANEKNTFIRPNMVIATSLPYTMLDNGQIESVLNIVRDRLLTPKGLRSLSADNPLYCGHYVGDQTQRDRAYHNGTVWVWLLEHYVRARFRLEGAEFIPEAKRIIQNFQPDIDSYGIATLAEIYDGDAPHLQRGAISQAWSVAAILEIQRMIENNQR
jgi:glycogen debranching enzyme